MKTSNYNTQSIQTRGDISLLGSLKVIGKVLASVVVQGAGLASGASKATALELLATKEGSWANNTLRKGFKRQFKETEVISFNYTSDSITAITQSYSECRCKARVKISTHFAKSLSFLSFRAYFHNL